MVTFKYVDDLEKLVKDFLEYQYKANAWLFEDKKKGKTIADSIKDEKNLPWLERFGLQQSLLTKIEELRNNLKGTKKEKPSLIDNVNEQLKRIQQLNILLNQPPRFYQDWKEQKLPSGVDISLLPHVAAFFKGVKTVENKQNVDSSNKIQDDPNEKKKKTYQDTQKRIIKREDTGWRIYFDGKDIRLDSPMAVKYISVALTNPGQKIPYSDVVDAVKNEAIANDIKKNYSKMAKRKDNGQSKLETEEMLYPVNKKPVVDSIEEHPFEEVKKAFESIEDYWLDDRYSVEEKQEVVRYFKKEYGYRVVKKLDTITLGKRMTPEERIYITNKKIKRDSETVRKARLAIMTKLETLMPDLHNYLSLYLPPTNNGLLYNPPEDDPPWLVTDK